MFRMINKLKSRKGFTLIELIVVLAVLAIIMAIAVPRFLGVQEQAKIDADDAAIDMIQKAGELYFAQNSTETDTTKTIAELKTAGVLSEFKLNNVTVSGVTYDASEGTVTVNN